MNIATLVHQLRLPGSGCGPECRLNCVFCAKAPLWDGGSVGCVGEIALPRIRAGIIPGSGSQK